MLTLFHAPNARSSRIVTLIDEMGITDQVTIQPVDILRRDSSGARDPRNPHPEGKVPALLHDGTLITESSAIIFYLTSLFPDTPLAPKPGDSAYGTYLTWLHWYGAVMEPVMIFATLGLSHPGLTANFRGPDEVTARIGSALAENRFLLGDAFTAADLLVHSPYAWMPNLTPDVPAIRDWIAACQLRPSYSRTRAMDDALVARRSA